MKRFATIIQKPSRVLAILGCIMAFQTQDSVAQICTLAGGPNCSGMVCQATVHKNVYQGYICSLTMSTNANCNGPGSIGLTASMTAMFTGTGTDISPICAWNCCYIAGIVTMTMSDGLPVELLEFSTDSDDTEADAEESTPDGDPDG